MRLSKTATSLVLALSLCASLHAQQPPRVYFLDAAVLGKLRADLNSPENKQVREQVEKFAARAMKVGPYSVTMKERVPPSGDKHDFLSMAPYHWPDPKNPNGPYIRRDGERNPAAAKVPDRDYLADTVNAAYTLSVAYYLTGGEKYADRAALLLRTWFLDPATRMNPNMNHGQMITGINTGRGAGLIETRHLTRVIDALGLLAGSKSWTATGEKGMREWLSQYLDWLQTSKNGRSEARAPNNHGSWYEQQVAVIALYLGNDALAKEIVQDRAKARIAHQIEPDGKQPLELQRTKALHYSAFNLSALTHLARAGDALGVDLWNFRTADGRGIRTGLDWLLPYVTDEKKFEYKQISDFEYDVIEPVLLWSALKYNEPKYAGAAFKLLSRPSDIDDLVLRAAWKQKQSASRVPGAASKAQQPPQ